MEEEGKLPVVPGHEGESEEEIMSSIAHNADAASILEGMREEAHSSSSSAAAAAATAATATASTIDWTKIINAYGAVIGISSKSRIQAIIQNLQATYDLSTGYFSDLLYELPILKHDTLTGAISYKESGRKATENVISTVARGSYGVVSKGQSGFMFKKMECRPSSGVLEIERHCKDVFLEAFIQTVLYCDETYGQRNICHVIGLYRDIGSKRPTRGSPSLPPTCYYKMELAEMTMQQLCEKLSNDGATPLDVDILGRYFVELGTILEHFFTTYHFTHRDLHMGNVMFHTMSSSASEQDIAVKLIDFGRACLVLDGVKYSLDNDVCLSYDLLIFILSFMEFLYIPHMAYFAPSTMYTLSDLVTSKSTKSVNLYFALKDVRNAILQDYLQTPESKAAEAAAAAAGIPYVARPTDPRYKRAIFHYVYYNQFSEKAYPYTVWSLPFHTSQPVKSFLEKLSDDDFFDQFLPGQFTTFWKAAITQKALTSTAGGRRRRGRRMSKRQKRQTPSRKTRRTK